MAKGLSGLMGWLSRAVLRGGGHGDVCLLTRLADISAHLVHSYGFSFEMSHMVVSGGFTLLIPI